METHESLTECQEVTLVLENYLRDFNSLAEWFRLKWDYENTPIPQRPTSLAWDICKTNLTKNNRSGKSSPNVGSGRSSPNVSGKVSPRLLLLKPRNSSSAPTSPLPGGDVIKEQSFDQVFKEEVVEKASKPEVLMAVDSPSEDQKTYDILRKVGVKSSEKSTSTTEDFPKLPSRKQIVKVNQECQTDEVEKKTSPVNRLKIDSKVAKLPSNAKPAYATALGRCASTKTVWNRVKSEIIKPTVSTLAKTVPKPLKSFTCPQRSFTATKTSLSRSKTVGDMKPTSKTPLKSPVKQERNSIKTKPHSNMITCRTPTKDCSSSLETLVNQTINVSNSTNSIASSVETLNNEKLNAQAHTDGWLTVKCRSRFKNNGRSRRNDLSWATRFHQVSATASLPALALLPETSETKQKHIDKTAKDSLNALKRTETPPNKNKNYLKRSHTTLSRITIKNQAVKNHQDNDSETEAQDLEEEHRIKARELSEEEERLNQEIAELQGLETDVDTETDGTETDGELPGENEDKIEKLADEDDDISLEARYEPVLAGKTKEKTFRVF